MNELVNGRILVVRVIFESMPKGMFRQNHLPVHVAVADHSQNCFRFRSNPKAFIEIFWVKKGLHRDYDIPN